MTRAGDKLYHPDWRPDAPRPVRTWRYVAVAVLVGMAVGTWWRVG